MKWRRSFSLVAVFIVMTGSLLGSEPEERLQVRWGVLKKLIGGKKVTLQFAKGTRVEGRVQKVRDTSLVVKVKKSSEPAAYPKGKMQIPRKTVSRIEARGLKENNLKRVLATVGTFAGSLIGSYAAVSAAGSDSGGTVGQGVAIVAIPTGAAVLVYRALAPKDVTIIEILPDSPGERGPKPTDKAPGASSTVSGGTPGLSPVEPSDPGQFRLQARQSLMRKGRPLDLSSLPLQGAQTDQGSWRPIRSGKANDSPPTAERPAEPENGG